VFVIFLVTILAGVPCGIAFEACRRETTSIAVAGAITAIGVIVLFIVGFDPTQRSQAIGVGLTYLGAALAGVAFTRVAKGGRKNPGKK
jgi:drug/metabolite transporter (DMT)-like permease